MCPLSLHAPAAQHVQLAQAGMGEAAAGCRVRDVTRPWAGDAPIQHTNQAPSYLLWRPCTGCEHPVREGVQYCQLKLCICPRLVLQAVGTCSVSASATASPSSTSGPEWSCRCDAGTLQALHVCSWCGPAHLQLPLCVCSWSCALRHGCSSACSSEPPQKSTTHRISDGRSTSLTGP